MMKYTLNERKMITMKRESLLQTEECHSENTQKSLLIAVNKANYLYKHNTLVYLQFSTVSYLHIYGLVNVQYTKL